MSEQEFDTIDTGILRDGCSRKCENSHYIIIIINDGIKKKTYY